LEEEDDKAEETKDKETVKEGIEGHNFCKPLLSLPSIPLFFFSLHRTHKYKKIKRNGKKIPVCCERGESLKCENRGEKKSILLPFHFIRLSILFFIF
jgi:hypothetical protein